MRYGESVFPALSIELLKLSTCMFNIITILAAINLIKKAMFIIIIMVYLHHLLGEHFDPALDSDKKSVSPDPLLLVRRII